MICVGGPFAGSSFAQDRNRSVLELFEPKPMKLAKDMAKEATKTISRDTTRYTKRILTVNGTDMSFWALEDMSTEEALNTVFAVYSNTIRIATRTRGGERGGNSTGI